MVIYRGALQEDDTTADKRMRLAVVDDLYYAFSESIRDVGLGREKIAESLKT
jgi:hypothetical protein